MAYLYTAFASFFDANKRFVNLTQAPTLSAHNALTGAALAGAVTITNIAIGRYRVQVTEDALTDVMFGVVPHVDDQALHSDVPLLQEKVYHVADDILVDTPSLVWEYAKRTLTMTPAQVLAYISQTSITQVRGNTWTIALTDLTLDANLIQFAIKRHTLDTDAQALLMIDTTIGLLYINGVEATVAQQAKASLSYVGTTLTITVYAEITAQLPVGLWRYGIQSVTAAGVVTEPYGGVFIVSSDIVRATD